MKLLIICGPPASGKMTVGQELQKLTGYKLFHNHLSLELVNQFFDWGTPHFKKLDKQIRFSIFEEVAKSNLEGLIFTYVWAFDEPTDTAYIEEIVEVFKERNPTVCFVDLVCDLEERLQRNKHENRLQHKPSKRDVVFSEKNLLKIEKTYRMNSYEGEFPDKEFFKIDNTKLTAQETAVKIVHHFQLIPIPDLNLFMMCTALNPSALSTLPSGFHIRKCKRAELPVWKAMPFDNPTEAKEYASFMDDFFETVYGEQEDLFFEKVLFVCNGQDEPIATCFIWKAYGEFNTIHWMKTVKEYEGLGIGRALISYLLKDLSSEEYPIYLHTQPGSYRAIKLYSDFGFQILSDKKIGTRENDFEECLPFLQKYMPEQDFLQLKITSAPTYFLEQLALFDTEEF